MPDLILDLRYLKYARLVAEQGSFHRAAYILNLSQSTVSRRIALLENRVGIQLFERDNTGVKLTPIGERFLREATHGAGVLERAVRDVALTLRADFGNLQIGLVTSLAGGFLADLLIKYHQRFPNIELMIQEATSRENATAVIRGHIDAAFIPSDPRLQGCRVQPLWRDQLFVAVPDDHFLSSRSSVVWRDIRNETILVAESGSGPEVEAILIRELSSQGFYPKIRSYRVGRDAIFGMVGLGFGAALAAGASLGTCYRGVKFIPIVEGEPSLDLSIVWLDTNSNPALNKLLELSFHLAQIKKDLGR